MTYLSIVQDALVLLGLPKPGSVASSSDPAVLSMGAMVNQTGKELMHRHAWEALQTEKTFTTVAQAVQTDAIPSDFDRFINNSLYNRTQRRRLFGPLSPQKWQRRQALTTAGIYGYFRQRGGSLLIDPVPTAGETIAYEYVTKNWVTGDAASMTVDIDTALIDENLLMLGAIWRFLDARGLEYAERFRTYEIEVGNAWAKDGGKDSVNMGDTEPRDFELEQAVVPDGDWDIT